MLHAFTATMHSTILGEQKERVVKENWERYTFLAWLQEEHNQFDSITNVMNPRYCHTSEWAFNSLKSLTYYSNQSELKQNCQIVSYVFTAAKDYKPVFVLLSSAGFVMIFETRSPFEHFVTKLASCYFSFVLNRNLIL